MCHDTMQPTYEKGKFLRCPTCQSTSWHVGRITAECACCARPVALAHVESTGTPTWKTRGAWTRG